MDYVCAGGHGGVNDSIRGAKSRYPLPHSPQASRTTCASLWMQSPRSIMRFEANEAWHYAGIHKAPACVYRA